MPKTRLREYSSVEKRQNNCLHGVYLVVGCVDAYVCVRFCCVRALLLCACTLAVCIRDLVTLEKILLH